MHLLVFGALLHFSLCLQHDSVLPPGYSAQERKYLLYDVNHPEGFNLRRDVFMRVANTVRLLRNDGHNYVLVLPPWGGLYHWRRQETKLPWSIFFDFESLNEFVPVIEFEDFLQETNYDGISAVAYLQQYSEGWTSETYEIKFDRRDCIDGEKYYKLVNGKWQGWFFSYSDVWAHNFSCVSIQGDSVTLAKMIGSYYSDCSSLFVDRAEQILHNSFGDKYYWEARRSMRYAQHLRTIADDFRKDKLGSTDLLDLTTLKESWKETEKKHGDAKGGDYLCVHWRRRDFVHSHSKNIPSIQYTAKQLMKLLNQQKLSKIFLSTDASDEEVESLKKFLSINITVERYVSREDLSDGEVSIIDQWICAHARFFIGTYYSTFSYRIQEDREILGFLPETTFNRLCPDENELCEQPAKWMITYTTEPVF